MVVDVVFVSGIKFVLGGVVVLLIGVFVFGWMCFFWIFVS